MSWYWIINENGVYLYKIFASTIEDLAANVPAGHTVKIAESQGELPPQ